MSDQPAIRVANNPFRTLLVHRNFRLFWTGQTLSLTGTWMQTMARGWLALQLSNSAFVVGLMGAMASVPVLLFSFSAGEVADRTDKLRLVQLAQALMLAEAAVLWWLTWNGRITVGWLLGLSAASGLFSAFEIPARQAMMVDLVGRDDLHEAIALNSSGFNVARILGPSAGAAVIASLGLAWCFALNALSYVAVLIGLFMIRIPAFVPSPTPRDAWSGVREGVRYMLGTREVRVVMGLVAASTVLCVPYLTLMPVFARDRLGAGAGTYGALLACVGVGGLAGALYLAATARQARRGWLLAAATFGLPTLLLAFAFVRNEALAMVILLGAGFTMILGGALSNAILQSVVPDAMRGRLMSAYSFVVVGLAAVGNLAAGKVASMVGVGWTVAGGSLLMLVYAVLAYRAHPDLAELA
jgi:MFS family permease